LVINERNSISLVNLNTKNEKIVSKGKYGNSNIAICGDNSIIVSEGDLNLRLIDLKTGSFEIVGKGRMPSCLKKYEAFFYYEKDSAGKFGIDEMLVCKMEGEKIFIQKSPKPIKIRKDFGRGVEVFYEYPQSPAVPISDESIVFLGENNNVFSFSAADKSIKDMGISNCVPRAFRSKTEELLCQTFGEENYYLYGLELGNITPLAIPVAGDDFGYSAVDDSFVFSTIKGTLSFRERRALVLYDCDRGKMVEIFPDRFVYGIQSLN